jgi:hypothetical protein
VVGCLRGGRRSHGPNHPGHRWHGNADLRAALPILRYCEELGEEEDPAEATALLGAPTTTLEEWSRKQAAGQAILSPVA